VRLATAIVQSARDEAETLVEAEYCQKLSAQVRAMLADVVNLAVKSEKPRS
jgi:hypothetical protein